MARDRNDRAREVFEAALERPPGDRAAFARRMCGGDSPLWHQVQELLVALERAGSFLEDGPPTATSTGSRSSAARLRIGPYRVDLSRVVGTGRLWTVHEAEQDRPRRVVALKVLRRGLASDALAGQFEREVDRLARLRQPGVAQVYGGGVFTDPFRGERGPPLPYIAMEFITGAISLTEFARSRGLPVRHRLELLAGVCDSVHAAHEKGLVHGDLRPSNILVDTSGQTPLPKVTDFRLVSIAGAAPGGPQCDVSSLGLVLLELLTGRAPGESAGRTIAPAALGDLDQDARAVVVRSGSADVASRYQTAADLRDDLLRLARGSATAPRPNPAPSVLAALRTVRQRLRSRRR